MAATARQGRSARPGTQSRFVLANQILEQIRSLQLGQGRHLVESSLAERLGVSRTLARAALKLLAERGIVASRRNQGFFLVRAWDQLDGEMVDFYPIQSVRLSAFDGETWKLFGDVLSNESA